MSKGDCHLCLRQVPSLAASSLARPPQGGVAGPSHQHILRQRAVSTWVPGVPSMPTMPSLAITVTFYV